MNKKERIIVFVTGCIALTIFTFTDLQISTLLYTKNLFGRILEVTGEIPFVFLALFGSVLLFRFRSRKNLAVNMITAVLSIFMILNFLFMGGFMTWNYLCENLGEVPVVTAVVIGAILLAGALFLAFRIPEEHRHKAVTYGIIAVVYFLLVIVSMNVIKASWGRMRMREMTDTAEQFTRWYVITARGGFDNVYASFPSGHSMNSAAVILLTLLPAFVPALYGKDRLMKIISYTWVILVGSSRVVMGAHFASDVVMGIMLSFAIFELTRITVSKLRHEHSFTGKIPPVS